MNGRSSGQTTQTDTCSQHNRGKSQGRPPKSTGSKPIDQNGLPTLRSPKKAPVPITSTTRPRHDFLPLHFHAPSTRSDAGAAQGCRSGRPRSTCREAHRADRPRLSQPNVSAHLALGPLVLRRAKTSTTRPVGHESGSHLKSSSVRWAAAVALSRPSGGAPKTTIMNAATRAAKRRTQRSLAAAR
jgi:hypothetical protein